MIRNFNFRLRLVASFSVLFASLAAVAFAVDPPKDETKKDAKSDVKILIPDEAKDHDGETVIIEFKVAAAKETDSGVCFLNSSSDRNDTKRFTAFITQKGLKKFKEDPKTEKPADLFKGKKIQVSGAIKKYHDAYEIEISSPDQIKIMDEDKKADSKSENKS